MLDGRKKINRREALSTFGKATAVALAVSTSTEVFAQSTTLSFVIETYRAYVHSAPQYNWETRIYLYGASQTCVLFFMKEGQAIPANTVAANGLSANVHFPNTRLAEIREFIRNERPIRITVVGSNGIATLSNEDYELVGDADI